MKIYLATWLYEPSQGHSLTKKKALTRLLSFYHLKEKAESFVNYCRTGRNIK